MASRRDAEDAETPSMQFSAFSASPREALQFSECTVI
jgi:hypothetical protein